MADVEYLSVAPTLSFLLAERLHEFG
jgi:hypothetical protein